MSITLNLLNISIWIGVSFWAINTINVNAQTGGTIPLIQEQIKSDGTLNTSVSCSSNICNITRGQTDINNRNLFHSFSEFSVPTGGEAYFNNPGNIQNIISRVTGTNISNIDGKIRSNGATNFFLINPNGVVISNNASLNTTGTFTSEKADQIQFGNQGSFRVNTGNNVSLLTVNPSAILSNQIIVLKPPVYDDIPNINNSGIIIPTSPVQSSQKPSDIALINYGCHMEKGNKFLINNIIGILPNVREAINDEKSPLPVAQKPENTLVEATGWTVNEKGEVVLIAQQRNVTNDNFVLSSCNTY